MSHFEFQEFSFSKGGNTFLVKMSCIWMRIKKYFYVSGFVLSLAWNRGLRQLGNGLKQSSCIIKEFNSGTPIWQPWRHVKRLYSNFWVCTWNPKVWTFKWKLLNSNSTWYYLFFSILQNEIWQFCRTLTWPPLAVKRSNHDISLYILHTVLDIFSPELMRLVNSFWKHSGPSYLIISFTFITCKLGLKEWYNKIWSWSL